MFLCFQMVDESPTGILRETDLCPPFRKTLHHWIHTVVEATKRPKQQCRIPPDFGTVPLANIYESLSIRMAVSTSWPVNANKQTTAAAMLDIREKLAIPLSRARDSRFDISRSSGRRAFIYHLVDTLVNSFASQIPYECSWFVLTYEVQCSCWVSLFFFTVHVQEGVEEDHRENDTVLPICFSLLDGHFRGVGCLCKVFTMIHFKMATVWALFLLFSKQSFFFFCLMPSHSCFIHFILPYHSRDMHSSGVNCVQTSIVIPMPRKNCRLAAAILFHCTLHPASPDWETTSHCQKTISYELVYLNR